MSDQHPSTSTPRSSALSAKAKPFRPKGQPWWFLGDGTDYQNVARHDDQTSSLVCRPELRDPWSNVHSFMPSPGPLRRSCRTMLHFFANSIYLEVPFTSPYLANYTSISLRKRRSGSQGEGDEEGGSCGNHDDGDADESRHLGNAALMGPTLLKWTYVKHLSTRVTTTVSGLVSLHIVNLLQDDLHSISADWIPTQCVGLGAVEIAGCQNLSSIGNGFLVGGVSLETVIIRDLPRLTRLGNNLCSYGEKNLQSVELRGLSVLQELGQRCCSSCPGLKRVVLRDLPLLKKLGDFLLHSTGVEEFILSDLPSLQSIGSNFMAGCSELIHAGLVDLPKLASVGTQFCSRCPSLEKVDLKGLPHLATMGHGCFQGATRIQHMEVAHLPRLSQIGKNFLAGCPELRSLVFHDLPELFRVGPMWLKEGPAASQSSTAVSTTRDGSALEDILRGVVGTTSNATPAEINWETTSSEDDAQQEAKVLNGDRVVTVTQCPLFGTSEPLPPCDHFRVEIQKYQPHQDNAMGK